MMLINQAFRCLLWFFSVHSASLAKSPRGGQAGGESLWERLVLVEGIEEGAAQFFHAAGLGNVAFNVVLDAFINAVLA